MSQIPVFSEEKASKVKRIQFSEPLVGQTSHIKGIGDLASDLNRVKEKEFV